MQHPFIGDLSELSLDEVQEKISQLTKNLSYIYRTGNSHLAGQMQMAIESYKAEATKRLDAMYKKQNIKDRIKIEKSDEI